MFHVPEKYRQRLAGHLSTSPADGNNGVFKVRRHGQRELTCIASDGAGWEHVSVSLPDRCPTWVEMDIIKRLFWDDADCVVQYHPPRDEHVNDHPYCLHLWRPIGVELPRPSALLV